MVKHVAMHKEVHDLFLTSWEANLASELGIGGNRLVVAGNECITPKLRFVWQFNSTEMSDVHWSAVSMKGVNSGSVYILERPLFASPAPDNAVAVIRVVQPVIDTKALLLPHLVRDSKLDCYPPVPPLPP